MRKDIISAVLAILVLTLLCGIVYPLAITGVSQVAFPGNANGQKIYTNGRLVGSKIIGQAFTDEWGFGQILPLKKDMSVLLQVGVVGYDQWQVTDNSGTVSIGPIIAPAKLLPRYSVHAVGGQLNYILPARKFSLFFKYYNEYKSYSHTLGTTIVFGGNWTLSIPKPPPAK